MTTPSLSGSYLWTSQLPPDSPPPPPKNALGNPQPSTATCTDSRIKATASQVFAEMSCTLEELKRVCRSLEPSHEAAFELNTAGDPGIPEQIASLEGAIRALYPDKDPAHFKGADMVLACAANPDGSCSLTSLAPAILMYAQGMGWSSGDLTENIKVLASLALHHVKRVRLTVRHSSRQIGSPNDNIAYNIEKISSYCAEKIYTDFSWEGTVDGKLRQMSSQELFTYWNTATRPCAQMIETG